MRALLTGVVATIEAVAVALASLLVVAGVAFLVWWLAFDLGAEPGAVFAGARAAWLLAHLVPLAVSIPPETMQLLGFAPEALTFGISLAPLGVTAVTVGFAARSGWRFGARGGAGAAGVLGGALGFGTVAALVRLGADLALPGWLASGLTGALLYGVSSGAAFLVRAARDEHAWWVTVLGMVEAGLARARVPSPAAFPHRAGAMLRLAAMLLAAYVGLAALGMTAAFVGRFPHVIAASEALQLDLWGTVLMFVLQLALLPVLLLWSGAWLTGAGFAVGSGSSASPFGQLLGPLPGMPIFAAIPNGWGSAAVLAPLLLVLCGLGIGIALRDTARRQSLASLLVQVVGAAALTGLAVALANALASGALGPGRLAEVGPEVWTGAGLAAGELGVGALLGALAARLDIARRLRHAPAGVAGLLGLGDHGAVLSAEQARAHTPGSPLEEPETLPGHAGANESETEQTAPVTPLAQVTPLAPVTPLASVREETGWEEPEWEEPGWEAETVEQPDLPLAPEPELFDQHEGDTPELATDDGGGEKGARGADGDGADPDAALDTDALIAAYSWDGVEATPAEAPEARRGKWRWPGRKG